MYRTVNQTKPSYLIFVLDIVKPELSKSNCVSTV